MGPIMSVILECQPGNEIICIEAFHASPEGEAFSWDTSHHFQAGDRVRYLGSLRDAHYGEQTNGWLVRFETPDGRRYAATQTYFVTEECWLGLEKFFRENASIPMTSGGGHQ
jgi:hypothetical protein